MSSEYGLNYIQKLRDGVRNDPEKKKKAQFGMLVGGFFLLSGLGGRLLRRYRHKFEFDDIPQTTKFGSQAKVLTNGSVNRFPAPREVLEAFKDSSPAENVFKDGFFFHNKNLHTIRLRETRKSMGKIALEMTDAQIEEIMLDAKQDVASLAAKSFLIATVIVGSVFSLSIYSLMQYFQVDDLESLVLGLSYNLPHLMPKITLPEWAQIEKPEEEPAKEEPEEPVQAKHSTSRWSYLNPYHWLYPQSTPEPLKPKVVLSEEELEEQEVFAFWQDVANEMKEEARVEEADRRQRWEEICRQKGLHPDIKKR